MPNGIKIYNREFRRDLADYSKASKRDLRTIIDTKGFYISRGAVRNTLKTPREKIKSQLTAPSDVAPSAPLAAIIINSILGGGKGSLPKSIRALVKQGKKGLQGAAMKKAERIFISAKQRTRAFLAAGFLPAVKVFERLAEKKTGAPRVDRAVKQYGKAKGSGIPTRESGWVVRATITNSATGAKEEKGGAALIKHAGAALQQAFNDEAASMRQYVVDKMQKTANQFKGRKH
jgi:hypothetical protein